MKLRWAALIGVLAFSALAPRSATAQATLPGTGRDRGFGSELGQNSPNPFVSETRMPFMVGDYPACTDPSRIYRVSLRVYNILSQLVAVPVLQGGTGSVAGGAPLESVELACGQYTGYWDAKNSRTGQDAPPGIYLYRLEIDGRPVTKKMIRGR
jgi:hypothetical protein